jgi:hypothetical protein
MGWIMYFDEKITVFPHCLQIQFFWKSKNRKSLDIIFICSIEMLGFSQKSTHSTPRSDPSTALRTSTRGMLRVDTERRLLPRFTKESIIEKTYSS